MSDIEEETAETLYKPSFVLIAIDTDPSMFVKRENDEQSPFKACVSACYQLADSLIFTQNKRSWSPFGIALGRDDDLASLVNFNDNVLNSIKLLKAKNSQTNEQLQDVYQRKGTFDLSAFFLFCKKKFKEIKSAFYKRTIIFITNDDDPVKGDKNQRFAALNEAKTFEANDIEFQMVTMNHNFNYQVFYNELFSVIKSPLVEVIIEDEEGLLEKLTSSIVVRYFQRRLNFFPIKGDQSRFLKVIQKKFIQEQKLYNNMHVTTEGKPVKKISKKTADVPKKFALKHSNGEQLEFDVQENFDLKNNDLPIGYSLIYVSNRVSDVGEVLTDTALLEVDYKEDLPYFNSFWQYCVDNDKVLLCVRKLKQLDNIRFVEFIPKFANGTRMFIIKTLPFTSECKHPPTKLAVTDVQTKLTSDVKITQTNRLIDALTFDYHPKMFINPSFAKKKAFLKSKFLDEEKEDVEDVTLDNTAIDSQLSEIAEQFKSLFKLEEQTATKRKRTTVAEKSKKKK